MTGISRLGGVIVIGLHTAYADLQRSSLIRSSALCLAEACEHSESSDLFADVQRAPMPSLSITALLALEAELETTTADATGEVQSRWVSSGSLSGPGYEFGVPFTACRTLPGGGKCYWLGPVPTDPPPGHGSWLAGRRRSSVSGCADERGDCCGSGLVPQPGVSFFPARGRRHAGGQTRGSRYYRGCRPRRPRRSRCPPVRCCLISPRLSSRSHRSSPAPGHRPRCRPRPGRCSSCLTYSRSSHRSSAIVQASKQTTATNTSMNMGGRTSDGVCSALPTATLSQTIVNSA